MSATKEGKLHMKDGQVDDTDWVHILWQVQNLHFLTCKLLQGSKIKCDHKNNIGVQTFDGNIILDPCIKTHDGWVAGVAKLAHPSEVITHATIKSLGIHLTGLF